MNKSSIEEITEENPKLVNSILILYFLYKLAYTAIIASVLLFIDSTCNDRVMLFLEV
jgi:hypothetical protein